jgi:hypothetical protein
MVLLRLLICDRKYNCCFDLREGVPDEPKHSVKPQPEQTSLPLAASRTRSTFTVNSPSLLPDLSQLSISHRVDKKASANGRPTDCRLIIGACYSLRSVLSRLSPDASLDGFYWDCPNYRLLYFGSPTGWKFIALLSQPCKQDSFKLTEYYDKVFVPLIVKSPLYYHRQVGDVIDSEGFIQATKLFFAPAK